MSEFYFKNVNFFLFTEQKRVMASWLMMKEFYIVKLCKRIIWF